MTNLAKYLTKILVDAECRKIRKIKDDKEGHQYSCFPCEEDICKKRLIEWLDAEYIEQIKEKENCSSCSFSHEIIDVNNRIFCDELNAICLDDYWCSNYTKKNF